MSLKIRHWTASGLALVGISVAGCQPMTGYGPGRMHDWAFGYGFGGMWMWLLILVVVGVLVYFLVTASKKGGSIPGLGRETPMEILKRRYAAGEISGEEFERMKKDLLE